MSDPTDLLVSAFAKFLDGGFSSSVAQRGLFGFWVEPVEVTAASPLDRALASAAQWDMEHGGLKNPYYDVVAFLQSGGSIGRWENNVLDVQLGDGSRYGIPLRSFVRAAAN